MVGGEGKSPIAEAVVQVEGTSLSAATNAVGQFVIVGVPAGKAVLTVEAAGYLELTLPWSAPTRFQL